MLYTLNICNFYFKNEKNLDKGKSDDRNKPRGAGWMGKEKPVDRLTDFEGKTQKAFGVRGLEHRREHQAGYLDLGITFEIKP